ncbi:hypothetical protein [Qipengyuania sp. JC766]|uniref:phenylacetate--CoA ligase family protein n=1 Tax=Qipengyuania sp. JC766 TaxID=3232139 RepID=UPI00345B3529
MASRIDRIYARLPVFAQDLAISVQGWRFRRARFGGAFRDHLAAAERDAKLDPGALARLQLSRLQAFVAHAYDQSPFYRAKYDAAGVHPRDLVSLEDIRRFPPLEKEELRSHTSEIQARSTIGMQGLQAVSTSGTTGTPIRVAYTPEDTQRRFAYLYRMLRRFGIQPSSRSVRFSGRTLFPSAERNGIFWRHNHAANQLLMSTYHMTPANLDAYVEKLQSFAPEMLDGYPSAIFLLARHVNRRGMAGTIAPRLIMTTAETLEDFQREEITCAFPGSRIGNQYASSEGAPFVTEDEFGELILNTDTGLIETADGSPEGEMLVTSFTTHAFPLIRYRIGDTIAFEPGRLARSMAMPVVKAITGRQEDLIVSPDRGPVGRLDPVFKKMPSTIVESQIEQVSESRVALRVVPDMTAGYRRDQLASVIDELEARLGRMEIEVQEVDTLERGANGKLRAVKGIAMRSLTASG